MVDVLAAEIPVVAFLVDDDSLLVTGLDLLPVILLVAVEPESPALVDVADPGLLAPMLLAFLLVGGLSALLV